MGLEKEKEPCNSNGLETGTWCIAVMSLEAFKKLGEEAEPKST